MAGHGTYAPSKFALCALADAPVMETRLYPDVPVKVHLVLPNSITTAGYEREKETKLQIIVRLESADKPREPEDVARLSIAGIEGNAMSNSLRNNWFVETLMVWFVPFILAFVMWDMNIRVSLWGKKTKEKESAD
ncbi:hypothetical protein F4805DRAFT_455647 [Annulohypoxylon moriforme]|nr:hypothetical protein F4805DRAFT_455647 [Annulohypoxylon moriforme]